MSDLDSKIAYKLRKGLDKYDRVELDTKLGKADFMAIDQILTVLTPTIRSLITTESIQLLERLKNYAFKVTAEEVVFSGDVVKVADIDDELTKLREGL